MNDYWAIAQRHLAEMRAHGLSGAANAVDPLDDGHVARVRPPDANPDRDNIDAVLITSPTYGDVWLIADDGALDRHPDIIASGAAVLSFVELERLRGMTVTDRHAYISMKRAFPTARPVQ